MPISHRPIVFRLNKQKALSSAAYIIRGCGGNIGRLKLLKLIFIADRYHIRKYLRPVTGDKYYAMKLGPVATFLYNVCKGLTTGEGFVRRGSKPNEMRLGEKEIETNIFSPSDIEALEFALTRFGNLDFNKLTKVVHAYPEWAKFAARFEKNPEGREEIDFADFFDEQVQTPDIRRFRFKDPFPPLTPSQKNILREELAKSANRLI